MSAEVSGDLFWRALDQRVQKEPPDEGVWTDLKEKANISNYQPCQAEGMVHERLESQRDGVYYMLNNPHAGTYLKLDERDFYIWSLMDGSRSIKQLVVAYFSEFGSIAFGRVNDLVAQFRAASFLSDPPVGVYAQLNAKLRRRTLSYWGERVWRMFLQKELAISGIDGILTKLYRYAFWVFYIRPALALYPAIVGVGLALFFYTVQFKDYPIFLTGDSVILGILTFAAANIVTIGVHEAAHAFTTKHYQRKVRKSGLLLYFGSPAFFVDTMDIWMEPKKARIAVSWAGPYSGLILGSVCMFIIAATGFSDALIITLLFKLAIWAFVFGALTNLNPLLEWDGYFMLMDWLEIPMLRKRSMNFVKRNFFNKLFARERFSREETIFAVFGVTALVYTVGAIGMALFFWQSRVQGVLGLVEGWIVWLIVSLFAVVLGIPLALGVGVLLFRVGQGFQLWVYQKFLMERPGHQVAALCLLAAAVSLPVLFLGDTASDIYSPVVGGVALALGLLFSVRVAPWYLGSRLQWFFLGLPWLIGLLLFAQLASPFEGGLSSTANVVAHGVVPAVLLVILTFLFPNILSFNRTVLQGSWVLLVAGVVYLFVGALVAGLTSGGAAENYVRALDLLGYGFIAASLFRLQQRLQSLRPEHPGGVVSEAVSDVERLSSATKFLVEGALEQFVQIYGRRALGAVEDQFNAASSLGAGLGISIKNGRVVDTGEGSLLERSQEYASALSRLFAINSHIGGRRFVERELRSLYSLMPWEQREIGDEHLFFRLDWMSGIHRAFATTKNSRVSLLRSAPLFSGVAEEDIRAISESLVLESYPKGRDIIRQGDHGDKFYIIESGTVEVWIRHQDGTETLAVELGRGDYFGEWPSSTRLHGRLRAVQKAGYRACPNKLGGMRNWKG